MTESITVHSISELNIYKDKIVSNLNKCVNQLREILAHNYSLEIFQVLKFEKCVTEPLSGNDENLIEVINQSMTYGVSIMAVEYLYKIYSDQTFIINWGNIAGYDIQSEDGTIICECFAATSYKNNKKLATDLERLNNVDANHKYEFFYDKEFGEKQKMIYQEKYPQIQIVKFEELIIL